MDIDTEDFTKEGIVKEYHHIMARKILLLIIGIVGIVIFVGLFSISTYPDLSIWDAYEIIWNHINHNEYPKRTMEWWADRYIWDTAMPHAVVGIIAGCALAICGTLMQSLMGNPLADPYTTGISSGACFGAVAAIVTGISFTSTTGEMGIVTNAFIGAMVPALLIIIISIRIHMTPATLILLGTAISYFFNSMVTYMMITTDADTLKSAYLWQIGSLDGMTWSSVPIMLGITVIGTIFSILASRQLNIMSLGENNAKSLGVDVQKFRIICLTIMAIMTAAVVSYTGILGFVGLVAPHIVRLVAGSDNKFVIPLSMVLGALLILFSDYIAYQLESIPIGVILSVVGSPVFLILILVQSKKSGVIY